MVAMVSDERNDENFSKLFAVSPVPSPAGSQNALRLRSVWAFGPDFPPAPQKRCIDKVGYQKTINRMLKIVYICCLKVNIVSKVTLKISYTKLDIRF